MKHCTIYGCNAAAPRNSKICIEHIRLGLNEHGFRAGSPIDLTLDRGASSLTFVNRTASPVNVGVTMFDGEISSVSIHGGKLTDNDMKAICDMVARRFGKDVKCLVNA